jgi:hypothetical protein
MENPYAKTSLLYGTFSNKLIVFNLSEFCDALLIKKNELILNIREVSIYRFSWSDYQIFQNIMDQKFYLKVLAFK